MECHQALQILSGWKSSGIHSVKGENKVPMVSYATPLLADRTEAAVAARKVGNQSQAVQREFIHIVGSLKWITGALQLQCPSAQLRTQNQTALYVLQPVLKNKGWCKSFGIFKRTHVVLVQHSLHVGGGLLFCGGIHKW